MRFSGWMLGVCLSAFGVPVLAAQASSNFAHLIKDAQGGDPEAQFRVGWAYHTGTDTTVDYVQAAVWYRRAADHGNRAAQTNLGTLYERGLGVPHDDAEAFKWNLRAAAEGFAPAQNNVGVEFANASG